MNTLQEKNLVNWSDGMKLNKEIFIAQDNALLSMSYQLSATNLSEIKYGILASPENFKIEIAIDNQNVVSTSLLTCKAITLGGVIIKVDAKEKPDTVVPILRSTIAVGNANTVYWSVLIAQPYDRTPFGEIDNNENPARLPFLKQTAVLQLVEENELKQYLNHPLALIVGKVYVDGSKIRNDDYFIPACMSIQSSEDLIGLHAELDSFLSSLELACSQIVQKIYRKSQQNDLSELAQFLCDRIMIFLAEAITHFRTTMMHEPPVNMISKIVTLARLIKNTIDLRMGSGKDELMNYLCEWCDLKQGELEVLLTNMSVLKYNHYDINSNITPIVQFAKVIGKLFTTLSNLEFIGKKKESGLFVKEEVQQENTQSEVKPKRRFFG